MQQRLQTDEDSRTERKTWQVLGGKKNIFRLHFSESREDFCRRGRGRSFLVDGPKTDKALELTNSGESGGRNLEAESIRSKCGE